MAFLQRFSPRWGQIVLSKSYKDLGYDSIFRTGMVTTPTKCETTPTKDETRRGINKHGTVKIGRDVEFVGDSTNKVRKRNPF